MIGPIMSRKGKPPISMQDLENTTDDLFRVLASESGLGATLIGCAYLEHAMGALLRARFGGGDTCTDLLDPLDGFLASFKARADVAYCIGLISAGMKDRLNTMMSLRNSVAHSPDSTDPFDNKEFVDKVSTIKPTNVTDDSPYSYAHFVKRTEEPLKHLSEPRRKFTFLVVSLLATLASCIEDAEAIPRMKLDLWS